MTGLFANRWWIVAGCTIALATSSGVVMAFTFGLFIEPLTAEMNWSRATVSLGFSATALATAFAAPAMGRLFDRVGAKRALFYTVTAYAGCVGLLALIPPSVLVFVLLFALAGVAGSGHSPIAYVKIIIGWFDSRRGLALGLAMSGIGVGAVVLPQIARWLIEHVGWRLAYPGVGLFIVVTAMPAIALLLREPPARADGAAERAAPAESRRARSASLVRTLRDWRFLRIVAFVALLTIACNGVIVHAAPLLVSRGYSTADAAGLLGALGASSLLGRLSCGYVLDRVHAPVVAAGIAGLALVGMLFLWGGVAAPGPLLGVMLIGFSQGAETDLIGYLVSRYFGLRRFGELVGYLYAVFAVSAATGAPLMGLSFDLTQSYATAIGGFTFALLLATVLIARLGPYAFPAHGGGHGGDTVAGGVQEH